MKSANMDEGISFYFITLASKRGTGVDFRALSKVDERFTSFLSEIEFSVPSMLIWVFVCKSKLVGDCVLRFNSSSVVNAGPRFFPIRTGFIRFSISLT